MTSTGFIMFYPPNLHKSSKRLMPHALMRSTSSDALRSFKVTRTCDFTGISLGFHGVEFDLMGFHGIYRLFLFGAGTEMTSWTLRPALQFGAAGFAVQKWLTRRNPNTDIFIQFYLYGDGSKPWYLVNPKIAGKWMFIPLKMVLIGIDPYPYRIIERERQTERSNC